MRDARSGSKPAAPKWDVDEIEHLDAGVPSREFRFLLRSFLGGLLVGARSRQDIEHAIVPLVTRVLEYRPLSLPHGKHRCPGSCERLRIVDRVLVAQGVSVDAREAFDHVHLLAGSFEHRLIGEIGRVDDKRIALPVAAGHVGRHEPLKGYCQGLLLPLKRKSVEPMAARLAPYNVRRTHQSLHHLVADSPWSDQAMLAQVRAWTLPRMKKKEPLVAWVVDDTGIPKKGKHSVGVARQYRGQLGKQENCQVAVSLSAATWRSSLPIAWRLYLPESWARDRRRRRKAGVPDEVGFQTKPQIALDQIRQALENAIEPGVVLADAAYGNDSEFRAELRKLKLEYVVGIQSTTSVWKPGEGPLPPEKYKGQGRPPKLPWRGEQQPLAVRELALGLPPKAWKKLSWRQGEKRKLASRFAALRVRPAHRNFEQHEAHPEQWLLIEWPSGEVEPAKYWLSNLPAAAKLKELVALAKHRWIIERDYQELKQELGLNQYEGRGWRGFHHHGTLCIAAYGFLVGERSLFPPLPGPASYEYPCPRGLRRSARAGRPIRAERHNRQSIATLQHQISHHLLHQLDACLFCGAPFLYHSSTREISTII